MTHNNSIDRINNRQQEILVSFLCVLIRGPGHCSLWGAGRASSRSDDRRHSLWGMNAKPSVLVSRRWRVFESRNECATPKLPQLPHTTVSIEDIHQMGMDRESNLPIPNAQTQVERGGGCNMAGYSFLVVGRGVFGIGPVCYNSF